MSDDALKLIVKISEGSVRDALSLLDRALLSLEKNKELSLKEAQKIFGFFDKSQLIDIFELILQGEEKKVIEGYRNIYDQGVEPKVFINDFLELIYYFKNIDLLTYDGNNFSLNDDEFSKIKQISKTINNQTLILFWQFTIRTIAELDVVSNQNLSIEMFLLRLMYLISSKSNKLENDKFQHSFEKNIEERNILSETKNETINQIKNISQNRKIEPENEKEIKAEQTIFINSFDQLLKTCIEKKEIKLKYELEKNVNLVNFSNKRIEISFNDNLDKNFVKELSSKLFEWTNKRWIITFSKLKGEKTIKEKELNKKKVLLEDVKRSKLYKEVIQKFPDAKLIDVNKKKEKD